MKNRRKPKTISAGQQLRRELSRYFWQHGDDPHGLPWHLLESHSQAMWNLSAEYLKAHGWKAATNQPPGTRKLRPRLRGSWDPAPKGLTAIGDDAY